jgi:hypothetical protein
MNIFEQFLNKISYKFDKGYPDMKNPKDIVLIKKSISEVLGLTEEEEENYDDQILNLLATLSDNEAKKRVIAYLSKFNKKENKEDDKLEENIIRHYKEKNIEGDVVDSILYKLNKINQLQQFSDYLDNPTVTHSDLLKNNNLNTLFENIPINPSLKSQIINASGALGNVTFGKGELALISFLKGAVKFKSEEQKGDVKIEGHVLEIKQGKFIVASMSYISRAKKSDLFKSVKSKEFIEKYNIDLRPKISWVTLITRVKPTEKEIKDILDELYPGLEINIDISSAEALNTSIGLALAKDYLDKKDLFLISKQLNYACVENYDMFEKGVRSGLIKFDLASDIAPRCYIE